MNRINSLFQGKQKNILSIYFTAGFPQLHDTVTIISELQNAGVDMIEIGIPFSDPLADGPTIQRSSEIALKNGMNVKLLFQQLKDIRITCPRIPLVLMGYLNPILQYGVEQFCRDASLIGIDGIIIPDLPMLEYLDEYKPIFEMHQLKNIFLITPQTSEERVRLIDDNSNGFIYMVSSASTTGGIEKIGKHQEAYFNRIKKMNLKNPILIGFGISTTETFSKASEYANGAIIGSAFINAIDKNTDLKKSITFFIHTILKDKTYKLANN